MKTQIFPSGAMFILCGDNYYEFLDKDFRSLKIEDKRDSCISKLTVADLPEAPEELIERWFGKRRFKE